MNIHYSSCPVRERTTETFVEHVKVGGSTQRVAFSREIIWLQESESTVLMMHGGRELDVSNPTYNDFYGYLTSMAISSPSPEGLAAHYGVDASSTMSMVVRTTIYLRPVMETDATRAHNATKPATYKTQYVDVPHDWRGEATVDGETTWPRVQQRLIGEGITWSSKNTPEQNKAAREAFSALWSAPVANA